MHAQTFQLQKNSDKMQKSETKNKIITSKKNV